MSSAFLSFDAIKAWLFCIHLVSHLSSVSELIVGPNAGPISLVSILWQVVHLALKMTSPLAASPCAKAGDPKKAKPAISKTDLENCLKINEKLPIKCIYAK